MIWSSLPGAVLQVAEHPDLLEHVPAQVVRLVDDESGGTVRGGLLQQYLLERKQHLRSSKSAGQCRSRS